MVDFSGHLLVFTILIKPQNLHYVHLDLTEKRKNYTFCVMIISWGIFRGGGGTLSRGGKSRGAPTVNEYRQDVDEANSLAPRSIMAAIHSKVHRESSLRQSH